MNILNINVPISKDVFFGLIIPALVTIFSVIINYIITTYKTSKWQIFKRRSISYETVVIGGLILCILIFILSGLLQFSVLTLFLFLGKDISSVTTFLWVALYLLIMIICIYQISKWKKIKEYILSNKKTIRNINIFFFYSPFCLLSLMLISIILFSNYSFLAILNNIISIIYFAVIIIGYTRKHETVLSVNYKAVRITLTNGKVIDHVNPLDIYKSGAWYTIYTFDNLYKIQEQFVLEFYYYGKEGNYEIIG